MRLKVPYFEQENDNDCGPNALKMVLSYFEKEYSISELTKFCELKEGKGLGSSGICLAVRKTNFNCEFYSLNLEVNLDNYELDFYKKYSDDIDFINSISKKARELGTEMFEKSLSLEEIISKISENCVPIVLLNWSEIDNKSDKYRGHFVPIVGYDKENIYVHTGHNFQENFGISHGIFEKARKSQGTDEDIIFISK